MKREIRSNAVASIAGVGAVIDVGQESFLIPGINLWQQNALRVIEEKRLSSRYHKVLKAPKEEKPSLMIRRFPKAMFCEKCRKITHWQTAMEKEGVEPGCPHSGCDGKLVAMRFVSACENGHLDDVDWRFWAHSGNKMNRDCRSTDQLSFVVDGEAVTAGLSSVKVVCKCGSSRSLEDISNKSIIKETFKSCSGRHPWIFGKQEQCDADVIILQRGATNLHYPSVVSALDLPTALIESPVEQFAVQIRQHSQYQKLVQFLKNTEGNTKEWIDMIAEMLADAIGCDSNVVLQVARAEVGGQIFAGTSDKQQDNGNTQEELLIEEWETMEIALKEGELSTPNFVAIVEELSPSSPNWLKAIISDVLLVPRLREVRAYLGFQRVKPNKDKTVSPDIGSPQNWLPASEVFGEGIVLKFNFELLEKWASAISDVEKEALIELEKKRLDENFFFLPKIDPIFLMIHTLAHLLLRRITFECGYSSSSLRERIYFNVEEKYAGIMIYTADGDSEGSLGGLVRQGRRDRLAQSIVEAIDQGRWCSSDPVCTETGGHGIGGFNHAACHACSLVSETSCTSANTLLDRRMIFDSRWGLLSFLEELK